MTVDELLELNNERRKLLTKRKISNTMRTSYCMCDWLTISLNKENRGIPS